MLSVPRKKSLRHHVGRKTQQDLVLLVVFGFVFLVLCSVGQCWPREGQEITYRKFELNIKKKVGKCNDSTVIFAKEQHFGNLWWNEIPGSESQVWMLPAEFQKNRVNSCDSCSSSRPKGRSAWLLPVRLFPVYFGRKILCSTASNANLAVLSVSLMQFNMSSSAPPLLDLLCCILCIMAKCFSCKIGKTNLGTMHKSNKAHGDVLKILAERSATKHISILGNAEANCISVLGRR